MNKSNNKKVQTRKLGAEHIIFMRIPAERFLRIFPSHLKPAADSKLRYEVALVAQNCKSNSIGNVETGKSSEFHLWLRMASQNEAGYVQGADTMLPNMYWFALAAATNNEIASSYLDSFAFNTQKLDRIDFREDGGSITLPDDGHIRWHISGNGFVSPSVGVNHVIHVSADGEDPVSHHIAALLSDAVMEQTARVYIETSALEPYLHNGERFAAAINRVHQLEADVVWEQFQTVSIGLAPPLR